MLECQANASESASRAYESNALRGLSFATLGRREGIRKAKGSVIVFIDSDMVVTDTFLSSHAKALHESRRNAEVCP